MLYGLLAGVDRGYGSWRLSHDRNGLRLRGKLGYSGGNWENIRCAVASHRRESRWSLRYTIVCRDRWWRCRAYWMGASLNDLDPLSHSVPRCLGELVVEE